MLVVSSTVDTKLRFMGVGVHEAICEEVFIIRTAGVEIFAGFGLLDNCRKVYTTSIIYWYFYFLGLGGG